MAPISGTSFDTALSNNATTDSGYADADGWLDGAGVPMSEMGHMFYVTLGNLGFCTPNDASPNQCATQTGWGLTNTADFLNVQTPFYWSGTERSASDAWAFFFNDGSQGNGSKYNEPFA